MLWGALQGVIILLLGWIKLDQAAIWKRMDNHYHEVSCDRAECKNLRTGNVIIPGGQ